MNDEVQKRLYLVVGSIVGFVVLVAAALIFLGGSDDDEIDPSLATVDVSASDEKEITEVVTTFLNAAGNYGFIDDAVTDDTVATLFGTEVAPPGSIYVSRQRAYNTAAQSFAPENTIATSDVSGWSNLILTNNLMSIKIDPQPPVIPSEGYIEDELPTVVVDAPYDTLITSRVPDANDSSSKGLFFVNEAEGTFTPRITLVNTPDFGWRIKAMATVDATISLAIYDESDTGSLPAPTQVDTLRPTNAGGSTPEPAPEEDDEPAPSN